MSKNEIENISSAASPIKAFIAECLEVGNDDDRVHKVQIIRAYDHWCTENQERKMPNGLVISSIENELRGCGAQLSRALRINDVVKPGFKGIKLRIRGIPELSAVQN